MIPPRAADLVHFSHKNDPLCGAGSSCAVVACLDFVTCHVCLRTVMKERATTAQLVHAPGDRNEPLCGAGRACDVDVDLARVTCHVCLHSFLKFREQASHLPRGDGKSFCGRNDIELSPYIQTTSCVPCLVKALGEKISQLRTAQDDLANAGKRTFDAEGVQSLALEAYRMNGYETVSFRDGTIGVLQCSNRTLRLMNTFQKLLLKAVGGEAREQRSLDDGALLVAEQLLVDIAYSPTLADLAPDWVERAKVFLTQQRSK